MTSHFLNQWWLNYWCIYASLGLNELRAHMALPYDMVHPGYREPGTGYKYKIFFVSGTYKHQVHRDYMQRLLPTSNAQRTLMVLYPACIAPRQSTACEVGTWGVRRPPPGGHKDLLGPGGPLFHVAKWSQSSWDTWTNIDRSHNEWYHPGLQMNIAISLRQYWTASWWQLRTRKV